MEHRSLYENTERTIIQSNYAGFLVRLAARLIDGIILSFLMNFVLLFFYQKDFPGVFSWIFSIRGLVCFLLSIAYYVYFETSNKQATIGKSVMNLKVIKQNGDKLNVPDAIIRYFSKILSTFIFLIGYLMVIFDDKKRALHDRIAGTFVVKA